MAPPATAGGVWPETVLYSFSNSLDAPHTPSGGVFIGPSGAVYGTTFSNHYFDIELGDEPPSGPGLRRRIVVRDNVRSNLYEGCGSVYELSPPTTAGGSWTGTAIYSFDNGGGCYSVAPLTVGPGGVLYGTTNAGGSGTVCIAGCGTVFQLTPPAATGGAWTEAVIYSFTGLNGDGASPAAGVVLGKNGVLYGTTTYGGSATSGSPCTYLGASGCGTVFGQTPPSTPGGAWTGTILHSFTGQNGEGSIPGPLTVSRVGVLYGPTWTGGSAGKGTMFAIQP